MFNDDDICYAAKLELRFDQKKGEFRKLGGGYVNAWTFAPNEEAARRNFIDEAPAHTGGRVVAFTAIGPGNPNDIETTDSEDPLAADAVQRPLTREELEKAFADAKVIFTTVFVWPKKRWWQFWRRDED